MGIVYGLKLACETYFYLAVAAIVGFAYNTSAGLLAVPALLGLGAGIGFLCSSKSEKARYPFLAIAFIPVAFGFTKRNLFVMLPMLVYAFYYVKNNRTASDYYYTFRRFRAEIVILPVSLVFSAMLYPEGAGEAVPAMFLFLTLSIALLRMQRHEEHVIRQRRFQLLNLLGLSGVCIFGGILSTDWFARILKAILQFFYNYALTPVIQGLLWVLNRLIDLLAWIGSLIPWSQGSYEMPVMQGQTESVGGNEMFESLMQADIAANPLLRHILEIAGILILAAIAFFLIRALSKHMPTSGNAERTDRREKLASGAPRVKKSAGAVGKTIGDIRKMYISFLRAAESRGVSLNGRQNSLQIRNASEKYFDAQTLDVLREAYIRARYGDCADETDRKNARAALKRLKEKNPNRSGGQNAELD